MILVKEIFYDFIVIYIINTQYFIIINKLIKNFIHLILVSLYFILI